MMSRFRTVLALGALSLAFAAHAEAQAEGLAFEEFQQRLVERRSRNSSSASSSA